MSDNDLIKRGDALKALDWGDIYGRNAQAAIETIPAVQPTVSPDVAALAKAAEKVISSYWYASDGVITGIYELETALARVKGETK